MQKNSSCLKCSKIPVYAMGEIFLVEIGIYKLQI